MLEHGQIVEQGTHDELLDARRALLAAVPGLGRAGGGVMPIGSRALSVTPVKGTRLHRVERFSSSATALAANRRFFVIDERDRMVNAKQLGELQTVVADCRDGRAAARRFPDGST